VSGFCSLQIPDSVMHRGLWLASLACNRSDALALGLLRGNLSIRVSLDLLARRLSQIVGAPQRALQSFAHGFSVGLLHEPMLDRYRV
jgi:hypothetical protein